MIRRLIVVVALFLGACDRGPRLAEPLSVLRNPSGRAPLSALLRVETNRPARVRVAIRDGQEERRQAIFESPTTTHEIPILGNRPGREIAVDVALERRDGAWAEAGTVSFETPQLPEHLPRIQVPISRPSRMEPGLTLIPLMRWKTPTQLDRDYGAILAVDAQGDIVWLYRADHSIDEPRPTARGTLLYLAGSDGRMYEIDMLGNIVRQWHTTGIPKEVPETSIPVEGDTFHHDMTETPDGHILVISTEVRRMPWPESSRPGARVAESNVIGDVLLEFEPATGKVSRSWKMFDLLDPQRRGFGSYTTGFYREIYQNVLSEPGFDWSHVNSVFHVAGEDAVLLSSNYHCAVFKLNLGESRLEWILGRPDGWRAPWSDLLFRRNGDFPWFCSQHAPEITPSGTVLLFDNGNRTFPPAPNVPLDQNWSAASEYRLDLGRRTVERTWDWGGRPEERFLSAFLSEADTLPLTGNVLVSAGGRIRNADGSVAANVGHHWISVTEVTHTTPAEKVWEVVIDDPVTHWSSYRAERIPSLSFATAP